jgi:protease-4
MILVWLLIAIPLASGCVSINLRATQQPLQELRLAGEGRDKILVIEVAGFISGERRGRPLLGDREASLVSQIAEIVRKAERDRRIKGVILRINSPGGTVTASDTIHHELADYKRRTRVPMIAQMLDLGTSGAYYIAQAADRIIAQPTTVTGSIGVIMVRPGVSGLLAKLGVDATEITSGHYKGMGSPLGPLQDDERALFQTLIDQLHARFVATVAAGRPQLAPDRIAALADGRIYSAQQAQEAGLIDELGYLDDAIARVKNAAGLDRATVVTYTRPGEYKGSLYAGPVVNVDLGIRLFDEPGFLYLWHP